MINNKRVINALDKYYKNPKKKMEMIQLKTI